MMIWSISFSSPVCSSRTIMAVKFAGKSHSF
jgi:hypothetical protein